METRNLFEKALTGALIAQVEEQIEQEKQLLTDLENDVKNNGLKMTKLHLGIGIADLKGDIARNEVLVTLAEEDDVREALVKRLDWNREALARLELIPTDGTKPTIN